MGDSDGLTARGRGPDPPWGMVIGTTIRLWSQRHLRLPGLPGVRRPGTALRVAVAATCAAALALAAAVTGLRHAAPSRPRGPERPMTALQAAAANRAVAAAWVAQQVSRSAIVSCDPEMCADLQAAGFPAGQLLVLQPTATDPLGSAVVVVTPAVRAQFGARLADVYAPLVIASFGSGAAQVQVRDVAPDGAAAFAAQARAALAARVAAGRQLLGNRNISADAAARGALLAGQVDPRLLVVLSLLAQQLPLRLVAFGDSAPGVGPGVPLRGAEIEAARSARLSALLALLVAQRPPYLPAVARIGTGARGARMIVVQFDAPGPLTLGAGP